MSSLLPQVDPAVLLIRLEATFEQLREKLLITEGRQRAVYFGMAQGILSAIRQAELIDQAVYEARGAALVADDLTDPELFT
jgi:hypothetical protein